MKKIITAMGGFFLSIVYPRMVSAVNIVVPTTDPDPLIIDPQASTVTADESVFRDFIQFINEYLRLILIVVAF
jgi:hypothetical protein